MEKFEFVEKDEKYKVVREGNNYRVFDPTGWSCTYPVNDAPDNWINVMIKKHGITEVEANGINAEGQPLHFSEADLKPFMRVVTKYHTYIVAERGSEKFLTRQTGWDDINFDNPDADSFILQVYAPFRTNGCILNTIITDSEQSLWTRQVIQQAPKTAHQLAIEEAEKALVVAQDNLKRLKEVK